MKLTDRIKPSTPKYNVPQLVSELLEAVTIIHKFHLVSKSYSEHVALGDFYGEVGDLADTIFESSSWRDNAIEIPAPTLNSNSPVNYLEKLANFVEQTRLVEPYSDLQNQMDEVKTLIFQTLYKLKNLR